MYVHATRLRSVVTGNNKIPQELLNKRETDIAYAYNNIKSAPKMCKRLLTSSIVRKEAFFAAKVCCPRLQPSTHLYFTFSLSMSPFIIVSKHGAGNLLPSEFLIDEEGKLVDIMRATKSNEHMSAERISEFLLTSYSWTSRRKSTARRTNSMLL